MANTRFYNELANNLFSTPLNFASVTINSIQELLEKITQLTVTTYDEIAALNFNAEEVKFETVIQPIINLKIYIAKAEKLCTFTANIHEDEKIRELAFKAVDALDKLKIDCEQRDDVYQVFQSYQKNQYVSEKINLHAEDNRFFQQSIRDCRRNGLHITDPEIKEKITSLKKEISQLSIQFESNISNENTTFTFSKPELEGLPEAWFTKDREVESGKFRVTLKYPDYYPIIENVKDREIRKKIYLAFNSRCSEENLPILTKVVQLRQQLAKLLGYESHVDYMAELRMIKSGKNIRRFLDDMFERFKPLFLEQHKKLTKLARELTNDEHFVLENYDLSYYNRLLNERELALNMSEFNAYFTLDKVIEGTFQVYESILGLKFIETENLNKWHEDVKCFDVYDFDSKTNVMGEKVGSFYLDLHPRNGKYSHAAVFDLIAGADISHLTNSNVRQLPVTAMVCNFPKEGYLSFDPDVTTFFHEFGHVMHFVCSKTKNPMFNGLTTELDFVEAPSQTLENWCYDHRILSLLSKHPITGESIPEEMASKIKKLRIANDIIENMRQFVLNNFDYHVHSLSESELANLEIKKCFQKIQGTIRAPMASVAEECFASSFGHMVGGYDVAYYSYMITNTYALDMFASKFAVDPLSSSAGAAYRKYILAPGSSLDGMDVLKNFLGRAPNLDAYFELYGMKSDSLLLKFNLMQPQMMTGKDSEIHAPLSAKL